MKLSQVLAKISVDEDFLLLSFLWIYGWPI